MGDGGERVSTIDTVFVAITHNETTTWVRADQILGIDETADRVLVKVAYMPSDIWLQSDKSAVDIFRRIAECANQ